MLVPTLDCKLLMLNQVLIIHEITNLRYFFLESLHHVQELPQKYDLYECLYV